MNNKIKGFIEIEEISGSKVLINVNNIVCVVDIEDYSNSSGYSERKGLTAIDSVISTPDSEYTFVTNKPYDEVINMIKASQFM